MSSARAGGATVARGAQDLVEAVPGLHGVAAVSASELCSLPSASLDVATVLRHLQSLDEACVRGADGVVLTTGTDTMEEVAYLLDLLWARSEPLVLTGAMRTADAPGADGPANLLAAVTVASAAQARSRGCLVVMNDEVHAAAAVRKLHTVSPAAFGSPSTGPVGHVQEGKALLRPRGARPRILTVAAGSAVPRIALLRLSLGDDTTLLESAAASHDGIVVEAFGAGHVPSWWVDPLTSAAERVPVVLASRTGCGSLLEHTYGFSGSESDLLGRRLLSAGDLDGLKARLLLTLALMSGEGRHGVADAFARRPSGFGAVPDDHDG